MPPSNIKVVKQGRRLCMKTQLKIVWKAKAEKRVKVRSLLKNENLIEVAWRCNVNDYHITSAYSDIYVQGQWRSVKLRSKKTSVHGLLPWFWFPFAVLSALVMNQHKHKLKWMWKKLWQRHVWAKQSTKLPLLTYTLWKENYDDWGTLSRLLCEQLRWAAGLLRAKTWRTSKLVIYLFSPRTIRLDSTQLKVEALRPIASRLFPKSTTHK